MDQSQAEEQGVAELVIQRLGSRFAEYQRGPYSVFWNSVLKQLYERKSFVLLLQDFIDGVENADAALSFVSWLLDTRLGERYLASLTFDVLNDPEYAQFDGRSFPFVCTVIAVLGHFAHGRIPFPPSGGYLEDFMCREIAERTARGAFDPAAAAQYRGVPVVDILEVSESFDDLATMASLAGHVTHDPVSIIVALHLENLCEARRCELFGDLGRAFDALSTDRWDEVLEVLHGIDSELAVERELLIARIRFGEEL